MGRYTRENTVCSLLRKNNENIALFDEINVIFNEFNSRVIIVNVFFSSVSQNFAKMVNLNIHCF